MTESNVFGLLFQAGMVGAFIVYALARDRRETAERKDRDEQWRTFLENQAEVFRSEGVVREDSWKTFLEDERAQRKEAMALGTSYVNDLASAIGQLTTALGQHELGAEKRHDAVLDAVKENRRLIKARKAA